MGAYVDFWAVTEAALRYTIRRLGLTATEAQVRRLMEAYLTLALLPRGERPRWRASRAVRARSSRTAPRPCWRPPSPRAGSRRLLEHVISVDRVKTYKPSPLVYALGPQTLGIAAGELLFVSSNGWDVAGAKAFGYQVAWCNRTGAPEEELGVRADLVVDALDALPR